jgi:hypothetical protein
MAVNKPDPVRNLGHKATNATLTRNPAGMVDYANNDVSKGVVRGPPRSVGVYQKFSDPKDGHDLKGWANYARSNSYSVDGRGRDPKGRGAGSDGHLASTKGWPRFADDGGSDSGEGRLTKSRK